LHFQCPLIFPFRRFIDLHHDGFRSAPLPYFINPEHDNSSDPTNQPQIDRQSEWTFGRCDNKPRQKPDMIAGSTKLAAH